MPIQTMDARLYCGFLQETDVGCCLSRFAGSHRHHHTLPRDHTEGVNYYFSFNTLHRINNNGNLSHTYHIVYKWSIREIRENILLHEYSTAQTTSGYSCLRQKASSQIQDENDTIPPPFLAGLSAWAYLTYLLEKLHQRLQHWLRFHAKWSRIM